MKSPQRRVVRGRQPGVTAGASDSPDVALPELHLHGNAKMTEGVARAVNVLT